MPVHMQNFKKFCWKLFKKILKTTFFCYIVARDERLKVSRRRGALPPPKKFFIVPRRPPSTGQCLPAVRRGCSIDEKQAASPAYDRCGRCNWYCGPFVLAHSPLRYSPLGLSATTYEQSVQFLTHSDYEEASKRTLSVENVVGSLRHV